METKQRTRVERSNESNRSISGTGRIHSSLNARLHSSDTEVGKHGMHIIGLGDSEDIIYRLNMGGQLLVKGMTDMQHQSEQNRKTASIN
jgi:hypothetical protein